MEVADGNPVAGAGWVHPKLTIHLLPGEPLWSAEREGPVDQPQVEIEAQRRALERRTRRLILMGSYLEHVTGDDPGKQDSLIQGLDGFLERDRDRELFDLPGKENENGKPD